jgi:hypothetical protein
MDRQHVMEWVGAYERAWRANDPGAVPQLFTQDVRYARSPYDEPLVGHAAVAEFWTTDAGAEFTLTAEPVAVEDATAVVRALVRYAPPDPQEYTDLWLLRFAADGRVADFEEWAYWPGRSYTARDDDRPAG